MDFFPYTLAGPQFIVFFAVLAAVCLGIAAALKQFDLGALIRPTGPDIPVREVEIDIYEAAYLRGGEDAPVDAALAGLVADGLLRPPARTDRVSRTELRPTAWRSDFERHIYEAVIGRDYHSACPGRTRDHPTARGGRGRPRLSGWSPRALGGLPRFHARVLRHHRRPALEDRRQEVPAEDEAG